MYFAVSFHQMLCYSIKKEKEHFSLILLSKCSTMRKKQLAYVNMSAQSLRRPALAHPQHWLEGQRQQHSLLLAEDRRAGRAAGKSWFL